MYSFSSDKTIDITRLGGIAINRKIPPLTSNFLIIVLCPNCSSGDCILNGKHRNKKQKYFCKNCKKQFTQHKYSEEFKSYAIALASLLGTQKACEILNIHTNTIYNWRKK